eukprot:Gb_28111 [translate_table: standard]
MRPSTALHSLVQHPQSCCNNLWPSNSPPGFHCGLYSLHSPANVPPSRPSSLQQFMAFKRPAQCSTGLHRTPTRLVQPLSNVQWPSQNNQTLRLFQRALPWTVHLFFSSPQEISGSKATQGPVFCLF